MNIKQCDVLCCKCGKSGGIKYYQEQRRFVICDIGICDEECDCSLGDLISEAIDEGEYLEESSDYDASNYFCDLCGEDLDDEELMTYNKEQYMIKILSGLDVPDYIKKQMEVLK